jgi:hypothetical protein
MRLRVLAVATVSLWSQLAFSQEGTGIFFTGNTLYENCSTPVGSGKRDFELSPN